LKLSAGAASGTELHRRIISLLLRLVHVAIAIALGSVSATIAVETATVPIRHPRPDRGSSIASAFKTVVVAATFTALSVP